MYFSYISFQLKKNRFDFLFNSNSLLDIHAGCVYFFLKKDNYCLFNIKEWNQSNDVIFMSLNCSILLFWSFCVFLWTYIHYAILFYMASTRDGLYGENKTFGKCNKQKIQFFCWIRKLFHFWERVLNSYLHQASISWKNLSRE